MTLLILYFLLSIVVCLLIWVRFFRGGSDASKLASGLVMAIVLSPIVIILGLVMF